MRCIYAFLLIAGFIRSCDPPNETNVAEDSHSSALHQPAILSVQQAITHQQAGDPTFIMTEDTVSIYGPHSITRNMLQDKNGNMWFATWQGIIRYDDKVFTNMTLKEDLGHFHVFSLLEDRNGNLWFGTIDGGLYRYDGKAFRHFTIADGLAGNTVFSMLEDKAGNIWFGTCSGLSRYDGRTFSNFKTNDGLIHDSVYAITQDKSGKLWLGTEGGINSFYAPSPELVGGGLSRFTREESFPFSHVLAMMTDKNGSMWISSQAGLFRYNPSASSTGEKYLTLITTNFTSNLFEDKTGKIWFGGDMNCYDGKKLSHYSLKEGQNSNNLFCIFEDMSGNLWLGSKDGVRRYEGKPLPDGSGSFTEFREKFVR